MMVYYSAVIAITLVSMLIMVVAAYSNSFLSRECQRGFVATFLCIILVAGAEWLGVYLDGAAPGLRWLHIAAKCVEFSLTPAIPVLCARAIGASRGARWMAVPIAVNGALELLSARFGFIFSVDAGNVYHRCGGYWIYVAAFLAGIVFLFFHSYHLSHQYQNRNSFLLALILTFLVLGTGVQIIAREIRVDWISVAISSMLFFIYYSDLTQQMDALTTLLNRRSFDCNREQLRKSAVVLFFDVDDFKGVNDTYGHAFGDRCLAEIGTQLKAVYGRDGLCYRFGGDEFCVILQRRLDAVEQLNSAFLHRMEERRHLEPRLPRISVGYAAYCPASGTVEEAMSRADEMMYRYKQLRRGRPQA
jgi:diguanylate cyclase (GGDEF)-like protein